jgi:hypothetical protein
VASVEANDDMAIIIWTEVNSCYLNIFLLYLGMLASKPALASLDSKALEHGLISKQWLSVV